MNKAELIKAIAEKCEFSQTETAKFLNGFTDVLTETLKSGDTVALTGFGTFKVTKRAERKSRNPQTGEEIIVPETKVPSFKAGKILKESIK